VDLGREEKQGSLIELFKIYNTQSAVKITNTFQPALESRTCRHTLKLQKNRCHLELRKYFFCERVVDRWNALDQDMVSSGTVNLFKEQAEQNPSEHGRLFHGYTVSSKPKAASRFPGAAHHVIHQVI
jgi:hypothetical protein